MITIFGAPGAGKTIQGQLLARKYNWEWISYRDLLLQLRDKDIIYMRALALMSSAIDALKKKGF